MKADFLGYIKYGDALKRQEDERSRVDEGGEDKVLFCEHPPVYTLGKSADKNNLLIQPDFLKKINAEVHETERGGDITYHGPGQLVGYPIIGLRRAGIGVKTYVDTLETALIESLKLFGIEAYQIEGLTGIWVGKENEIKRKIGAIGIRVKNGVSMHGFALNIRTDLAYFNYIVPCGITDKEVTSIQNEGIETTLEDFADVFYSLFSKRWNALDLQI